MARGSDELAREIADTREEIGDRLIELRVRGRRAARRGVQIALVAGALGGAAVVGLVAWRMSRPTTMRERAERLLPVRRLAGIKIPSLRLYVNDQAVAERAESPTERLVLMAARAAGTAAATALAGIVIRRITGRKA